jgi:hypothetical protein
MWLKPEPSPFITPSQRRRSLSPNIALPDGKQFVGPGWEIYEYEVLIDRDSSAKKSYYIYGKFGDGGGWHAWIDAVPNMGYGIIALSQASAQPNYASISPIGIRDLVQPILIPAFAKALTMRMSELTTV